MANQLFVSSIDIFKTDNIVLTQVGTGLHFDHFEWHAARILEAVPGADGDVGGFIFGDQIAFVIPRDTGGAAHDNPVFRAVMMHLQR